MSLNAFSAVIEWLRFIRPKTCIVSNCL